MKKVFMVMFCCCNLSAMITPEPGDHGQPVLATLIQLLFGHEAVCISYEEQQVEKIQVPTSSRYGAMNQGVYMVRPSESTQQDHETSIVQIEDCRQ